MGEKPKRIFKSCYYLALRRAALQIASEPLIVPTNLFQTHAGTDRDVHDMKRVILLALGLVHWLVIAGPLIQAAESTESHGLSVGAKAPGFVLKDKDGKDHALAEFQKGAKFVALVFYRSADW